MARRWGTAAAAAMLVAAVLMAAAAARGAAAEEDLCTFVYNDLEYDLNLVVASPACEFSAAGSLNGGQYEYTFNVCAELDAPCNGKEGVSMCQTDTQTGEERAVAYEANIKLLKSSSGYFLLSFGTGDDGWLGQITLTCDVNAGVYGGLSVEDTTTGSSIAAVYMNTVLACGAETLDELYAIPGAGAPCTAGGGDDDGGGGGLSGGSILLILILCSTVVYCGAGAAYNVTQKQATGADAVPNKEFWLAVPELTVLGAKFLVAKATGGGGGASSGSYSTL